MTRHLPTSPDAIRSIVFDLDGTLYVSPGLAQEIERAAEELVSVSRGVSAAEGRGLIRAARRRLAEILEEEPTLTRTCLELGIEVGELHRVFQSRVRPERHLTADPVLGALLDSLRSRCELYIYTNNNLPLTRKILALLGVEDQFRGLFTIEFSRLPKPDPEALRRVLENIGGPPESFLFVGDREQVDLKPANALGIPTILVAETADLLQVHKLLGIIP
ncbi:MAG: hypothetical protein A2091_08770 [Desulfuromonadales bacterium GWD2_61_12]|nr:MAG: hypothetical protein A2005_00620 [Desulfuromonadales bacterium GWC2_61_20]OGR32779.1 MAG: hypothetical protein A2091_08770 [Desulfuromonadales bacterium GWD2_61_12]HAD04750.1 HAD family hydrolase [Desulfuromonas sp.]HBT82745.1 HAD family hydrolase [Desulfuromonas sp.]